MVKYKRNDIFVRNQLNCVLTKGKKDHQRGKISLISEDGVPIWFFFIHKKQRLVCGFGGALGLIFVVVGGGVDSELLGLVFEAKL